MYKEDLEKIIIQAAKKNNIIIKQLSINVSASKNYWFHLININISTNVGNICFVLDGLLTGCGSIYMSQFVNSNINEKTKPIIDVIFEKCAKEGQGTVFTICGDNAVGISKNLVYWGFEQLYEYKNLQHGGTHKQRIYQKTIRNEK